MQHNFVLTLAVLGALLPASAFGKDVPHSAILKDIPLMPGMVERPAASAPGPAGSAMTTGTVTGNWRMVVSFYNESLRAEGWTPADETLRIWRREDETLFLGITEKDGQATVTFTQVGTPKKETTNAATPAEAR